MQNMLQLFVHNWSDSIGVPMSKSRATQARSPGSELIPKSKSEARLQSWYEEAGGRASTKTKFRLARAPIPMARRFLQIATAIWAEACDDEPLSNLEFGALGTLQVEPNIDRNGLAASIGVDRTNIGLIVGELERRGFVKRSVNPNDRRAQVMRMTPAGEHALTSQGRKTAIAREKILAPLTSAERETLYDLLERIIAANERYSIPGAGRRKRSR